MCCLRNVSGSPIRRRLGIRRLPVSSISAKAVSNLLDQVVEASSFVSDYEPQPGNTLLPDRLALPPYNYPRLYNLPTGDSGSPDTRDGVVTLGESRSYSVVKKPQAQRLEAKQEETSLAPETQSTMPTTVEIMTTTEPPVTTEMENMDIAKTEGQTKAIYSIENHHFSNSIKTDPIEVDEARHLSPTTEGSKTPLGTPNIEPKGKTRDFLKMQRTSYGGFKRASFGSGISYGRAPREDASAAVYDATPTGLPRQPVTETSPISHPEVLKHETRVETVSFHEEVVIPQKTEAPQTEKRVEIDNQKSYQYTNVHDQSYHHVKVTHLDVKDRPKPADNSAQKYSRSEKLYGMPEENYEVDESVSVQTNGRAHGIQPNTADKNKFGYVVEGRNFKKYRVEERTADGFIVGEYGVVRLDDGNLRGVRYTADSGINPKLIYDTLIKFLSL